MEVVNVYRAKYHTDFAIIEATDSNIYTDFAMIITYRKIKVDDNDREYVKLYKKRYYLDDYE